MTCPDCGCGARIVDSKEVYGRSYGWIWTCLNYPRCKCTVGCHKGTKKPLGTLANEPLRKLRRQVHLGFDVLWKGRGDKSRKRAYRGLAEMMGIPEEDCHVGLFNASQCQQALRIIPTLNGRPPVPKDQVRSSRFLTGRKYQVTELDTIPWED